MIISIAYDRLTAKEFDEQYHSNRFVELFKDYNNYTSTVAENVVNVLCSTLSLCDWINKEDKNILLLKYSLNTTFCIRFPNYINEKNFRDIDSLAGSIEKILRRFVHSKVVVGVSSYGNDTLDINIFKDVINSIFAKN